MQQAQQVPVKWHEDQYRSHFALKPLDARICIHSGQISQNSPALDKVLREMEELRKCSVDYTCENVNVIHDDISLYLRPQMTPVDTMNVQRYRRAVSSIVRTYFQYRVEQMGCIVGITIAGQKTIHDKAFSIILANLKMMQLRFENMDFRFHDQAEKYRLRAESISQNDGRVSIQDVIDYMPSGFKVKAPATLNCHFTKYTLQILPKV